MNKYILLVEDNPDEIELTLHAINKYNPKIKTVAMHDGQEAYDYLFSQHQYKDRDMSHKPEFILMDIKMPKLSGIELLKLVKENAVTKNIPVIMLTSSNGREDILNSYSFGASSYIRKPIDYYDFFAVMKKLLSYWMYHNVSNV